MHRSGSQIGTFRLCPRRWWYSRLARSRHINRYALFGSRLHTVVEAWEKYRKPPDLDTREGAAALAGLPYLPEHPMLVEHPFSFDFAGTTYKGRIDLVWGDADTLVVTDHKSIGDLKYAHSPESLAVDPQQVIYSYYLQQAFKPRRMLAYWLYYRRAKPKALPVVTDATPERMGELHDSCAGMVMWPPPPRDTNACDAYPPEGCPYRAACKPDRSVTFLQRVKDAP